MSCTSVGSSALAAGRLPVAPTCNRTGEFTGPASKISPESLTPGLLARVVYGPAPPGTPKAWAGAPLSPANTWFHTPFVQPSRLLFRTMNCCCDPLTMVPPANCESATNPPLANCGPAEQ